MVESESPSTCTEPALANPPDMLSGPPTHRLYTSLLQARRMRRSRQLQLLRRVGGALLLLLASLGLVSALTANSVSFLRGVSALHSISPLTPAPSVTAASSTSTASTSSGSTPMHAVTGTNSPLGQGAFVEPAAPRMPNATPASTGTISEGSQLPLHGRRIGLDPGHGPRGDLGAVLVDPSTGKLLLSEAEFNLDVALRCRDLLRARGASVMLTRETADTFTAPWPADANGDGIEGALGDDLQERIDILNRFHAEAFLSIHANGGIASSGAHSDIQIVYCGTPDCNFPAQSKQLGQLVLDQLRSKLLAAGYVAQGSQLVTDLDADSANPPQHLFLLGPVDPPRHVRATLMPGVVSESLYITSPQQAAELDRGNMRQAIALAYADALQAYLTVSHSEGNIGDKGSGSLMKIGIRDRGSGVRTYFHGRL